ncbi:MAG TPA: FAD:protein FMN transferase [Bryobacteraceae bacterium]
MLIAALLALQLFEAVEPHMGTLFRIQLYVADQAQAQQAFQAAFARIAQLDGILSDYTPTSELNQLSTRAVHHPVRVSEDLFKVLSASEQLSAESDGAFDVTIGPLTHLWRAARKTAHPPAKAAVEEALHRSGYHHLHLDAARQTVELDRPGMQLDVGGIAKGYAADEALALLDKRGIHSALVAASGDLVFSNPPPGEPGWKIGIGSFDQVLLLANAAVSTSGPAEQHLDSGGVRYSHIIDPKTGMGLTRDITASVIAPHGIQADGMATAVSVLGPERGLSFVEKHPGASVFIVTSENGRHRIWKSPR